MSRGWNPDFGLGAAEGRLAGMVAVVLLGLAMAGGAAGGQVRRATDDLGVEVVLSAPPGRIVSLSPGNTELLFALGLEGRLVGVTEFCDYPAAARQIEKVSDFNSPNVEKIISVRPDLVVAARGNDREALRRLQEMGVQVYSLDIQTVEQLLLAVVRLGWLTGVDQEAERVRAALQGRVQKVKEAVFSLERQPRVMWGYWGETIYTAGKGNIIDDVFQVAGGVNVGRAASGTWPQVGLETVVSWAPEVLISTYNSEGMRGDDLKEDLRRLREMDGWKMLPAVRQGRVYYLDPDWLSRPGPRLIDALEQTARYLHPGLFEEP